MPHCATHERAQPCHLCAAEDRAAALAAQSRAALAAAVERAEAAEAEAQVLRDRQRPPYHGDHTGIDEIDLAADPAAAMASALADASRGKGPLYTPRARRRSPDIASPEDVAAKYGGAGGDPRAELAEALTRARSDWMPGVSAAAVGWLLAKVDQLTAERDAALDLAERAHDTIALASDVLGALSTRRPRPRA